MKKSEMQEKFRYLLNSRKETLQKSKKNGNEGVALMCYGEICGIAVSMWSIGLIDFDQRDYIQNEAFDIYAGKEPEYEAC